jgi:16S rRNA (guanine966-N2)-methyltransferase
MRIVAGALKGRQLAAPKGGAVRPTSARAREALFNLLEHGTLAADGSPIAGAHVLDAFAGSGANGLEALSRGAAHVTFVDNDRSALNALGRNIAALGVQRRTTVVHGDACAPLACPGACDLAILDPPYARGLAAPALTALAKLGWVAPNALVCVEMAKTDDIDGETGLTTLDVRTYGKTKIVLLRRPAA